MDAPNCLNCNQPMKLVKKFPAKPRGRLKKVFGLYRFHCEHCDIYHTMVGDGFVDNLKVEAAVEAAKLDAEDYKGEKL